MWIDQVRSSIITEPGEPRPLFFSCEADVADFLMIPLTPYRTNTYRVGRSERQAGLSPAIKAIHGDIDPLLDKGQHRVRSLHDGGIDRFLFVGSKG